MDGRLCVESGVGALPGHDKHSPELCSLEQVDEQDQGISRRDDPTDCARSDRLDGDSALRRGSNFVSGVGRNIDHARDFPQHLTRAFSFKRKFKALMCRAMHYFHYMVSIKR